MRSIEAAVSPAQDPCMHFNSFWDPDFSSEQAGHFYKQGQQCTYP